MAASVHARLLSKAKAAGEDFNIVLSRYAVVSLGMANSRMKDFFDLRALALEGVLDPRALGIAIAATFKRRKTKLPDGLPLGLTEGFAQNVEKQKQWQGFVRKNRLKVPELPEVVAQVRSFLEEPLSLAAGPAPKG